MTHQMQPARKTSALFLERFSTRKAKRKFHVFLELDKITKFFLWGLGCSLEHLVLPFGTHIGSQPHPILHWGLGDGSLGLGEAAGFASGRG